MIPGPKPMDPEEKILSGRWQNCRDGDPATIVQMDGEPVPPKRLKGDALKFWREIVPPLIASGIARTADAAELAMLCEWHARYVRYSKRLDKMGDEDNALDVARIAALVKTAGEAVERIGSRFGLSPSDRSRLRVQPATKKAGVEARKRC